MDIPLQFHEFQHLNHHDRCPKYTESLTKSDPIAPSDLDALYTDLENLQGAANIRLRRLEEEVKILTEWCDKKDRSKGDVDLDFLSNVASGKRTRTGSSDDALSIKKQKIEEPSKSGSSKIKSKATTDNLEGDTYVQKPKLTYDGSNKFWSYVEPYCADITLEDIKTLEDSLESKVDINEYFKIPPLGKHYSEVWAKEDLIEEHQQSAKIDKKKNNSTTETNSPALVNMESNILSNDLEENCPYGKFTKILIAALVDENIMAPMTENEILENNNDNEQKPDSKVGVKRASPLPSAKSLECAIKDELHSLGLIDTADTTESDQDDEIFQELRRCQSELKAVRCHNKYSVNKLIALAKNAIKNQEVRQKAKVLDAEVQDVFRRFCAAKAKKKGLSRKDREFAWKTIRDRESLWKLVDSNECGKTE